MSDVKVVRYLLANNAPLVAVVSTARIQAGLVPQGTALPAIAVTHVSTVRRQHIAAAAKEYCIARVQVTVMAADYPTVKSVLALVRSALPRTRGTVNGVALVSLVKDMDGPDFRDDEAGIFMQSVDYIVTFNE